LGKPTVEVDVNDLADIADGNHQLEVDDADEEYDSLDQYNE
jgi:hypothetical protein